MKIKPNKILNFNKTHEETLDGFLNDIFKTTKSELKIDNSDNPFEWICDYINRDVELANIFVKTKIATFKTRREKLQFLYDCRACVKGELNNLEHNLNQFCCPSQYYPSELLKNPEFREKIIVKMLSSENEIEVLSDSLNRFRTVEKKILTTIDYLEDCKKVDCFDNSNSSIKCSNNQKTLIFYYFFKHCGLEPRVNIDIAPLAKFLHLIEGKVVTKIANSDFYKKFKVAPNFKTDKELINDLEAIKPLFVQADLPEIAKMISNEIDIAQREKLSKD